jgi:hypothetical protein
VDDLHGLTLCLHKSKIFYADFAAVSAACAGKRPDINPIGGERARRMDHESGPAIGVKTAPRQEKFD